MVISPGTRKPIYLQARTWASCGAGMSAGLVVALGVQLATGKSWPVSFNAAAALMGVVAAGTSVALYEQMAREKPSINPERLETAVSEMAGQIQRDAISLALETVAIERQDLRLKPATWETQAVELIEAIPPNQVTEPVEPELVPQQVYQQSTPDPWKDPVATSTTEIEDQDLLNYL